MLDDKELQDKQKKRTENGATAWEAQRQQQRQEQQELMDQQDDALFRIKGDDVYHVLMKGVRSKTLRGVFRGQERAIEELVEDSAEVKQEQLVPMEATQSEQRQELKRLSKRLDALENRQGGTAA